MTGVDIVGALLSAHAPLVAMATGGIKAGMLPEGAPLPAVLVRLVSSVDRQPLCRGGTVRVTDRVSVAVRAASYRDQHRLLRMVRFACAGRTGDIGGALRVSVMTAGIGPDVIGPGNSFEGTQDFRVSFDDVTT